MGSVANNGFFTPGFPLRTVNRTILAVVVAVTVALSGCAALLGGQDSGSQEPAVSDDSVAVDDDATGATGVNHTLQMTVDDSTADTELSAFGATYPREHFTVGAAKHEDVVVGVDTNDDGEIDRRFEASAVSGVNNNDYSFDVTFDSDYTLQSGDVVVVEYPAVSNPAEAGEYEVELRLNDGQTATGNVTIG